MHKRSLLYSHNFSCTLTNIDTYTQCMQTHTHCYMHESWQHTQRNLQLQCFITSHSHHACVNMFVPGRIVVSLALWMPFRHLKWKGTFFSLISGISDSHAGGAKAEFWHPRNLQIDVCFSLELYFLELFLPKSNFFPIFIPYRGTTT